MRRSVASSQVLGSAAKASATARTFLSPSRHGVSSGRKTSLRWRGRSRQRVGRFSNMVSVYRLTQNRFWLMSRSSAKRLS